MKKNILLLICGGIIGFLITNIFKRKEDDTEYWKKLSDKHLELMLLMNRWVKIKQEKKSISSFLLEKKYKKIAIYGMSYIGETLLNELKETNVEVLYGIDQNAERIYKNIKILSINDYLEEVDAVIVTAFTSYNEIREILRKKLDCPILSIEEILYDI